MSEQTSTRYTPWMDEKEPCAQCTRCRIKGNYSYGVLMRRRVTERDGTMFSQYKITCRTCNRSTAAHRSKLLTVKEWEGKQRLSDGLKYRTRNPKDRD